MTAIGCAEFESALVDLLAEPEGATRQRREALLRHAASCEACRGALDLLDLAAKPAELRDPIPDPGPEYWRQFEGALAARIATMPRGAARRRGLIWGAAAVAIAAGTALVLFVPHPAPTRPEIVTARPSLPGPRHPPSPPPEAPVREAPKAPPVLDVARAGVRSATPEPAPALDSDLLEEEDLAGAFPMGARPDPFADADETALFPPVDDLSEEEQARFAAWLAQEEARVRRGAA